MVAITTEIEKTIRGIRDCDLRGLRSIELPQLRSSLQARLDTHGRGTSNGSSSLYDESGRFGRLSPEDRASGASSELRNDNEPDPFTGTRETIFPDCVENKCCRTAYLLGRAEKLEELIEKGSL